MGKNKTWWLLVVVLCLCGCAARLDTQRFESRELGLSLEYPVGWQARPQRGSGYTQMIFFAAHPGTTLAQGMIVVTQEEQPGADSMTRSRELSNRRLKLPDGKVLSRCRIKVAGQPAAQVVCSYKTLAQPGERKASQLVRMREQIVVVQNQGKCYIIRYQNSAESYAALHPFFAHLVGSLRFLN